MPFLAIGLKSFLPTLICSWYNQKNNCEGGPFMKKTLAHETLRLFTYSNDTLISMWKK